MKFSNILLGLVPANIGSLPGAEGTSRDVHEEADDQMPQETKTVGKN
jgi:hypothetical protein